MSNQLLFGEAVQIIRNKDNQWLKIKSLYDGYTGWLTPHLVTIIDRTEALQESGFLASQFLNKILFNDQICKYPWDHRCGLLKIRKE